MLEPAKILLVDDQPLNLQTAFAVLSQESYQIIVARNGSQALQLATDQQPDLILLDVMMPDLDGFETCKRLREQEATESIPVIFLTARTEEADIERGFAVGGVDYIVKPFLPGELRTRVRTHLALRESLRAQEELSRLKSRFLAMAAHDLKNPLHSIIGYVEMLMMNLEDGQTLSLEDGETHQMLKTMDQVASHMYHLVEQVVEAEALEAGRVAFDAECCDLNGILRDVVEMNRLQANRKEITLHCEMDEDCYAYGDRRAVYEAFDNLVNNAVKYSPPGQAVEVMLKRDTPAVGQVRFTVSDHGQGLSEDDLARVFGRFERLSARPTGGESSSGLGLSIAKELVEQQGGTIRAESDGLGEGSTFTIDLLAGSCPLEVPPEAGSMPEGPATSG